MAFSFPGLRIPSGHRSGANLATSLGISVGDPVLYNEHLMYDQNDRKTHLSKSWFRSDRFRLRTVVQRGVDEPFYSSPCCMSRMDKQNKYSIIKACPCHKYPHSPRPPPIPPPTSGNCCPPHRSKLHAQVNTWVEAVQLVGRLMVQGWHRGGALHRKHGQHHPPAWTIHAVAPHLALLHSSPEDGALQPGLGLATLKNPVRFGNRNNDPVSLVISIAAVDAVQHSLRLRARWLPFFQIPPTFRLSASAGERRRGT